MFLYHIKMNVLNTLLFIILISIYKSEICNSTNIPSQARECHSRDIIKGDYACCYVVEKYTALGNYVDKISCFSLDKDEYDNVKLLIKSLKQGVEKMGGKFEKFDIDCSAKILYISLLSLMIFLL